MLLRDAKTTVDPPTNITKSFYDTEDYEVAKNRMILSREDSKCIAYIADGDGYRKISKDEISNEDMLRHVTELENSALEDDWWCPKTDDGVLCMLRYCCTR